MLPSLRSGVFISVKRSNSYRKEVKFGDIRFRPLEFLQKQEF